jgi:hypothetical protein
MIEMPAPALVHSQRLEAEIAAAGFPEVVVILTDRSTGLLRLDGADEPDRPTMEEIVAAHDPNPPGPDDDLATRIQAVHDDPDVPASVKKLTAALLGLNGEAAVAGRPTDTGR